MGNRLIMKITLDKASYNEVFGFLVGAFKGHAPSAIVAEKLIAQIQKESDAGKADAIDLSVELNELQTILDGVVHLITNSTEVTPRHIINFRFIAGLLKIKTAFNKEIEKLIPVESAIEPDVDLVLDEE